MLVTWLVLAASLALFFFLQLGWSLVRARKRRRDTLVRERLEMGREVGAEPGQADLLGQQERGFVAGLDAMFKDTVSYHRLAELMEQAGSPGSPGMLLVKMAVLGLLPAVLVGVVAQHVGAALLVSLLGLAPLLLLMHRRNARMQRIDTQLPTALEIMTISLRAGHSLAQTIELSAEELRSPLRDEFQRCAEEHALGRSLDEVLLNMSRRLPRCRALRTFVVAVLVLQQTGGNLIEIIERIIETLRMQSQYERKLGAMTAEGKSSARMLAGLPLAFIFLAYLADPNYIGLLFTDDLGQKLLVVSLALWAIGVLWTRRLVSPSSS